jgi:hypothetical protein
MLLEKLRISPRTRKVVPISNTSYSFQLDLNAGATLVLILHKGHGKESRNYYFWKDCAAVHSW